MTKTAYLSFFPLAGKIFARSALFIFSDPAHSQT